MLTRLKHIKVTKYTLPDGTTKTYYYHRRTGKRIHGDPGSEEFITNYTLAASSDQRPLKGSLKGLILDYKSSKSFTQLKPRTQKDYDAHLSKIDDKWGTMPLKIFEDIRIRKDLLSWRDELAINSAKQADYMWSVFRRVIQYAVHNGEITHNHLKNPGRLYKADRSDKIWLPEDVEKFMCSCSPELQTALALALHTGQRKGDLIRLSWTAYDGTGISLRQSKSNRKVYIPATQTLKSILDSLPRTAVTILTNTKGTPWTSDGFNTSWGKAAKRAKIEGLTFHDLRGTAVTLLAEQGCTSIEIASITGHSLKHVETILDHYGSRTKKIAQTAILRFEQSWVSEVGKLGKRNTGETKVTK